MKRNMQGLTVVGIEYVQTRRVRETFLVLSQARHRSGFGMHKIAACACSLGYDVKMSKNAKGVQG